jgi:hypothetical protein
LDTWKPEWGTLWSKIDGQKNQDDDTGSGVLISGWQDSAVVKFATTIHTGREWTIREHKKPRDSSTSAAITKAPFEQFPTGFVYKSCSKAGCPRKEYVHRRLLPIPAMVDDYNHFMNGVDIADQLRAKFTTEQQTHRTWLPLFYFCLDTTIVNAYLLSMAHWNPTVATKKKIHSTHRAFREKLVNALLTQYTSAPPARIYQSPTTLPIAQLDRPLKIHQKIQGEPRKCFYCRFSKNMCHVQLGHIGGAKASIKIRMTRTLCRHCSIYLCADCFIPFHNFKSIQ